MRHSMLGALKKGLFALTPLVITIALVKWLYQSLEALFGSFLKLVVGQQWYFPGLGIVMAVCIILIAGFLLDYLLIQKVYQIGEKLLSRIPLVKTLYTSLRQLMTFFRSDDNKMGQAVRVKIGEHHVLGLMTRQNLADLKLAKEGEVPVFIPMSYQLGGYTLLVHKSNVEKIQMNVEQLLKFSMTAGVLSDESSPK